MDPLVHREVLRTVEQALSGNGDLLSACRDIAAARSALEDVPENMLWPFVVVESDLDRIPPVHAYPLWEKEALRLALADADGYMARARARVMEALATLLAWLRAHPCEERDDLA